MFSVRFCFAGPNRRGNMENSELLRTERIALRLRPHERADIERAAATSRQYLSEWVRAVLTEAAQPTRGEA